MPKALASILALLIIISATTDAQAARTRTLPLGSDLSDIVRFDLGVFEDAKPILESMQPGSPWFDEWFGKGQFTQIALDASNAKPALRGQQRWRGPVTLQAVGVRTQQDRPWIIAAAMLTTDVQPKILFRRFKVVLARPGAPGEGTVTLVQSLAKLSPTDAASDPLLPAAYKDTTAAGEALRADVTSDKMSFEMKAGLKLRVVLVDDTQHGIRLAYPLGVGAIDPGLIDKIANNDGSYANILTPTFSDARIDKKTIWSHRSDQKHFRGEPFLRVMNGGPGKAKGAAGWTAVGFHITIMSEWDYEGNYKMDKPGPKGKPVLDEHGNKIQLKGPEWLTRGYDSHGCMRLRRNDVRFLHDLYMASTGQIGVKVLNEAEPEKNREVVEGRAIITEYHPWPIDNKRYKRVKMFTVNGAPSYKRDTGPGGDGLVITEQMPIKASDAQATFYKWAGLNTSELAHMEKMNDLMAEGWDRANPPPPCPKGETCTVTDEGINDLQDATTLAAAKSELVAAVPREGKYSFFKRMARFGFKPKTDTEDEVLRAPITSGDDYTSIVGADQESTEGRAQMSPPPAEPKTEKFACNVKQTIGYGVSVDAKIAFSRTNGDRVSDASIDYVIYEKDLQAASGTVKCDGTSRDWCYREPERANVTPWSLWLERMGNAIKMHDIEKAPFMHCTLVN